MTNAPRAEQVRATRQKVLVAARDLFVRRGYLGATIEAIAKRAAVGPQTVYNVVGGKAALLKAVWDVTLAGDDKPVPMIERPLARAMLAAADPHECLRLYARMGREMALTAPELLDRFTRRRGWSLDRYEQWLAATMAEALLRRQ
jgi:AcrR family transcriptional regulator